MPTYRYARGAAKDLKDFLAANLNASIDTISTEEAYAQALAHPTVYRDAVHPSPVEPLAIETECPTFVPADLHNRYWHFNCVVHVVMRAPDADLIVAQEKIRSYVSAVIQCLMADNTLGGLDVDGEITGGDIAGVASNGELQLYASVKVTVKREEN